MKRIILSLFIVFISVQVNCIEWNLTHQLISTTTLYDEQNRLESDLNYKPELTVELYKINDNLIDTEISYDLNLSYKNTNDYNFEISGKLYRGWLRYSTSQAELRVGLQKINFGTTQILRSLQWFDNINPHDPTKTTEGVKAVLGRYYFINNANIWLWGIWGDSNETSLDKFFYEENNLEFGGRVQYPFKYCEAGFSTHRSPTDLLTFDTETKYGLDLRWDMALGFWIESCLNVYESSDTHNYSRLLTIGTDYTFGFGNGIYCLFEHQYFSDLQEDIWEPTDRSGASSLLVSYPLGMFDSVRGILSYNWQYEHSNIFISYNRNYDYLSIYLNLFWNSDHSDHPNNSINQDTKSVQLMLETKF